MQDHGGGVKETYVEGRLTLKDLKNLHRNRLLHLSKTYKGEFKWSYHIKKVTVPQLDTIRYQAKPKIPRMGYILLVVGQRGPTETFNVIGYFQCHWLPLQPGYKALLLKNYLYH